MPANRELARLLARCNDVVAAHGQQPLYQTRSLQLVEEAFHVSVGWAFALPPEDECLRTYQLMKTEAFRPLHRWEIPVQAVKAKIGNVVTHIPLPEPGRSSNARNNGNSVFLG